MPAIVIALLVDRIFFQSSSSPAGRGSGVAATEARSLPRFAGVNLAGYNNVIVEVGPRQSVIVHADDNLLVSPGLHPRERDANAHLVGARHRRRNIAGR